MGIKNGKNVECHDMNFLMYLFRYKNTLLWNLHKSNIMKIKVELISHPLNRYLYSLVSGNENKNALEDKWPLKMITIKSSKIGVSVRKPW